MRWTSSSGTASEPFFLYYPTHLVHGPILRTPDSAPDSKDLYADNIAYLDKSVGKVVAEIDKLGLRENTLIIFAGDNGTARCSRATIGGRQINGAKGSMLEGGARVPLIASWKGTTPAGQVLVKDMVDFSDFHATFAELAGAKTPRQPRSSTAAASRRNCAARRATRASGSTCNSASSWYVASRAGS